MVVVCALSFASETHAHLLGQPPFFKVNGIYSIFYPVQSYSAYGDTLPPQDFSPGIYLVQEPIAFELEKSQLATIIPEEIVNKTKFIWDFGDGTKGVGFVNSHSYTKPGSYILTIYADTTGFEKGVTPQLLQSVFFDILPDKSYETPTAVILVNGEKIQTDQMTNVQQDVFQIDKKSPVTFSANESIVRTGKIVKYIWDFGDGEKAEGKEVTHVYSSELEFIAPSLRLIDEKGFISETSVGLKETEGLFDTNRDQKQSQSTSNPSRVIAIVIFIGVLLTGAFLVLMSKRR